MKLEVGQQEQLLAVTNPDAINQEVTWSSSKNGIVSVDEDGMITALKKGKATVTAKAKDGSGKKAKLTVVVN